MSEVPKIIESKPWYNSSQMVWIVGMAMVSLGVKVTFGSGPSLISVGLCLLTSPAFDILARKAWR